MTHALRVLLAFFTTASIALAQQLPPPQNPAVAEPKVPPQGPALVAPQNQPAAQVATKNAGKRVGKPPEFFAARRQAQRDRKQAAIARMKQFKADRAAAEEILYQDWHERYLADTPVRVALARAYEANALAWRTPYFYAAPAPMIVPIVYSPVIYAPTCPPLIYGTFFTCGW
jgi:hypothetical protein